MRERDIMSFRGLPRADAREEKRESARLASRRLFTHRRFLHTRKSAFTVWQKRIKVLKGWVFWGMLGLRDKERQSQSYQAKISYRVSQIKAVLRNWSYKSLVKQQQNNLTRDTNTFLIRPNDLLAFTKLREIWSLNVHAIFKKIQDPWYKLQHHPKVEEYEHFNNQIAWSLHFRQIEL